ncbi:MAG: c-type cytochrome [Stellaceae bacterium]
MGRYFSSPSAQFCALALTIGLICFSGDVRGEEDGDRLFRTSCGICHTIQPGQNRVGPSLAGVVGRKAGTAPAFNYSDANKNSNVVWDEAQLDQYLNDPKEFMPGTKMMYPGMKDPEKRKALIAYLRDAK